MLDAAEAEVLAREARGFAAALSDAAARDRYNELAGLAISGTVPDHLIAALEAMLELVLERGKPTNRAVLQAIFGKTPTGRQQALSAREVTQALQVLRGHTLQDLRVSSGPSRHTLVLETDRCRLTLELDSAGARVASLDAG
jgi:hypothetical protein